MHTNVVDFSLVPSFQDPIRADACVRVLTSDKKMGTVSHLTIYNNPEQFAQELCTIIGKGVPTILNGGWEGSDPSISLYNRLREALEACGFVLLHDSRHEDVLGAFTRGAVLMSDSVVVTREPYDNGPSEELVLFFPDPKSKR